MLCRGYSDALINVIHPMSLMCKSVWLKMCGYQFLLVHCSDCYSLLFCVMYSAHGSKCFLYTSGNEEILENGDMPPSPSQQDDSEQHKVKRPGLKMSYEEYKQMANLLVLHMRRVEDSTEDGKILMLHCLCV